MIWIDMNGNTHKINEMISLSDQQPNCKHLLPCGICTLTSSLDTCYLLRGKNNENINQDTV